MRFAHCRKNHRIAGFCIEMPFELVHGAPFRNLSVEACFLYSCLLNAQALINETDKKGYGFVLVTEEQLEGLLRCQKKKAARVLAELSDTAGLISVQKAAGKHLRVYVKNFERPILPPNARRKFGI